MPRLERMVESRNLCEFEKSVLVTLIGSVIQPNKVSCTDDNTQMRLSQYTYIAIASNE